MISNKCIKNDHRHPWPKKTGVYFSVMHTIFSFLLCCGVDIAYCLLNPLR